MTLHNDKLTVFIGSYAEAENSGVYRYEFDAAEGTLTLKEQVSGLKNPTFLNVDAAKNRLYAIAEGADAEGAKVGDAVAFSIEVGGLAPLNRKLAITAPSCHIQRDANSEFVLLCSYHGGRISLVSLSDNGEIGEILDIQQHEGSGPHPNQKTPHPHSTNFSPDGNYIFVPDLGIDRIVAYTLDKENRKLVRHGETVVQPGAGPRHMRFHPNGQFAFVINELDSTIISFRYDASKGTLEAVQTVSTLPEGFAEANGTAEIAISEDGRFLYGSNRGHDSLAVFAVDAESGQLTLVGHASTEGKHPRHFALVPGGQFAITANKDTDNAAVFRISESGMPVYTGYSIEISQPVCVIPVKL
ncbi:6-phosphogluconolactonase [Paenibacillus sp. BK033]|uniref:lactonase family protein n=1 Tax=Paenibacillus sp. BK033 TaxID=2512133 RepID=UPI00104E7923|nr:lactonase family protein [Paenibacillus sp. BK033]TCM92868.1 6-phosphogluconolactonase [Paenibacillus sp. BK033]